MKLLILALVSYSTFASIENSVKSPKNISCSPTKNYVATIEYLRSKKEISLREDELSQIADLVSTGCTGAFDRFEKVTKILINIGLDSNTAINYGSQFAKESEETTEGFLNLIRETHNPDKMDLDATAALNVSLKLAEFQKNSKNPILPEFEKVVGFCNKQGAGLVSKQYCHETALTITKFSAQFENTISEDFIQLTKFVNTDWQGPKVGMVNALNLATEVLENGPTARENFIEAYMYANRKDGLGYDPKEAISFAKKMAQRSYIKD